MFQIQPDQGHFESVAIWKSTLYSFQGKRHKKVLYVFSRFSQMRTYCLFLAKKTCKTILLSLFNKNILKSFFPTKEGINHQVYGQCLADLLFVKLAPNNGLKTTVGPCTLAQSYHLWGLVVTKPVILSKKGINMTWCRYIGLQYIQRSAF